MQQELLATNKLCICTVNINLCNLQWETYSFYILLYRSQIQNHRIIVCVYEYKSFLTDSIHFPRAVGHYPWVFKCSTGPVWKCVCACVLYMRGMFISMWQQRKWKRNDPLSFSPHLSNLGIQITPWNVLWNDSLSIYRILASLKFILEPQKFFFATSHIIKTVHL